MCLSYVIQHVPAALWQDSEDGEGDHDPVARAGDEEEGVMPVPPSNAPSASAIPERQHQAVAAAGGRRATALSLHSTVSSVSDSGAGDNNNGRLSFQQYQHQQPPPQRRNDSLSDSLQPPADEDDDDDDDPRPRNQAAGSLASFPSFPSFHTAPPEEEDATAAAGITVVDDVRTLGHVENHIVVLLPKAMDKIQYLLRPLRAQFLRGTPFCKGVVVLTETNVGQLERQCRSLEVRQLSDVSNYHIFSRSHTRQYPQLPPLSPAARH